MTQKPPHAVLPWRSVERLAMKLAHKHVRRATARGQHLEFDDALGEVALIYAQCARTFDPERGFAFTTYFVNSAIRDLVRIKRWVRSGEGVHAPGREIHSLHGTINSVNQDTEAELIDLIPDTNATDPEQAMIARQTQERLRQRAPLAELLAQMALDPPPEMRREVAALRAWRERGGMDLRDRNLSMREMALAMGLNWKDLLQAKQQMQEVLDDA